jgi:superfamily II DNA or RNA helicase
LSKLCQNNKKEAYKLLSQFNVLFIDEAHRSKATQFQLPAMFCDKAYYRYALTATPFMNNNAEEDMILQGLTGNIIAEVSISDLVNAGLLAQPYFKFIEINEPTNISHLSEWRDVYEQGIIHNKYRNKLICQYAMKLAENNKKVLVIIKEIIHGNILYQTLQNCGCKVAFASGKDDATVRSKILKAITKDKLDIVIATNIFDEGIDVKDISAVIMGAGTKSIPAFFQRTGRAIRKKENENNAIIIDFIDKQHGMLHSHSKQRLSIVKNEPAFQII